MECWYSERHERSQHLKGMMIPLAQRRMGMGRGEVAAAGRREQVGTEPSRAQSQAPSSAPVTASRTSESLLIGKETSSTDAPHLPRFPLLPAHTSALLTVPCAPSLSSPDRPLGRLERRDTRHGAILATTARSSAHLQTTMAVRSVVVCNR